MSIKQIIDNTIKTIKQLPNQELINLISELENLIENEYGNYTIGGGIFIKCVQCISIQEILNKYKSN